jgi:hypothetical protein
VKQCSWCSSRFIGTVGYQIYCSVACREEATKEKIAARHKELRRKKRMGKSRLCSGKCGTKLSMYNDTGYCEYCTINDKDVNKKLREIKELMHDYENITES